MTGGEKRSTEASRANQPLGINFHCSQGRMKDLKSIRKPWKCQIKEGDKRQITLVGVEELIGFTLKII
jgi:hypothetical protein